jgi:hypothetical protein
MVEYTCEGCGVHVVSLALSYPPANGFCVQCAFLCEFIPDPREMLAVRKSLDVERKARPRPRLRHEALRQVTQRQMQIGLCTASIPMLQSGD